MSYLMTIDAGTGSVRAVIFDYNGNQLGIGQQEWTHNSEAGVPNSMNFDFEKNWKITCDCIKKAITDANINAKDIKAVTASSMREGIVLYDKQGNELWAVANVDARADKEVKYLKENFIAIEEEYYLESGQTFALGALPRILWVKNNRPDIYEKTASVSMISDWVLAKLSGVIGTDPSNGGTTGVFSLSNRTWAAHQAKEVGIKDDIFPKVYESGEIIGEVNSKASDESGLSKGVPVVMGGGDVQLGSAGLGVVEKAQSAILGGTFWQQIVNIDSNVVPPSNMDLRINPHVVTGLSQAEGITFFSGLVIRWFRDAFCALQKDQARQRGIDTYTLLEEMASSVPVGSNGIMPIFSDEMKYAKWYHAAPSFINLNIDPDICNISSMFRSLQENAAIVSAINLEKAYEFSGVNSDEVIFAAGASKGFLWPQILSDVLGKAVKVPVVKEATALGGAMAAGVGAGIYESIEAASNKLVQWDKVYEPNMQNHKKYSDIKIKWQQIYKEQLKLVDAGLTTSMWKAPGL